ncbi:MAG: DUF1573 domain-containing protein [Gemmataceae bacterium]
MRRCVLPLLLAALGPAAAPAQVAPPWANKLFLPDVLKNPTQPPPPVVVHNFGTVPRGTVLVHKFTLTNIYDVPIQVIDVNPSCGCLKAYPPEKVLQPTESAEFAVAMDTGTFSGPNAQTVRVTIGPQYVSTAVLRIEATSRADVTLTPGAVDFGTVAQGKGAAKTVVLEAAAGLRAGWKLTGVVPPAGPLEVKVHEASRGFLGAKYQVTVSLRPDAPAGPVSETVALQTSDPAAPVVRVPVTGLVQAPVALSPERVRFPATRVGEVREERVLVRGSQPFRLAPVADAGDGVSVIETLRAAGPVQVVVVRFAPTKPGPVSRAVPLSIQLQGGGTVPTVLHVDAVGEADAK